MASSKERNPKAATPADPGEPGGGATPADPNAQGEGAELPGPAEPKLAEGHEDHFGGDNPEPKADE